MIDLETDEEFEERLAAALRHVDAPEGFRERVLQAAREREPVRGRVLGWPRMKRWVGPAIAAALLAGVLDAGVHASHQRTERKRVEREKAALAEQQFETDRQFETAMRVTQRALSRTREHLSRAGVRLED